MTEDTSEHDRRKAMNPVEREIQFVRDYVVPPGHSLKGLSSGVSDEDLVKKFFETYPVFIDYVSLMANPKKKDTQ